MNPIVSSIIENYKTTGIFKKTDEFYQLGPNDRHIIFTFLLEDSKHKADEFRKKNKWVDMLSVDAYVRLGKKDLVVWKNCRIFDI